MVLKIFLLIGLYFVFKTFFKAMRIVGEYEAQKKNQQSHTKQSNVEDIIDAEYRVVKE